MADQEERQAAEAPPIETETASKVGLIGTVAGTVVIGTAVGMLVVGPMVSSSGDRTHADSTAVAQADGDPGHAESGAGSVHVIDNMVLNPAMSSGSRFLLVATAVEVADAALMEELKVRDAEARDVLISVLGSRTVEQLSDLASRDSLRIEIARSFGTMLAKPNAVRRVYFPQFVVQ